MRLSLRPSAILGVCVLPALLVGLPASGVALNGGDVGRYIEIPPRPGYIQQPGFSWPILAGLALFTAVLAAAFVLTAIFRAPGNRAPQRSTRHRFPGWGWLGLGFGLVVWGLSWTGPESLIRFQVYMFAALWGSYIIVINGLTYRRTGACPLLDRPRAFALLFPVSAVFWWFFEYLNRFVQNWYYSPRPSTAAYILAGCLSFSTVLPAISGTAAWLQTFPRLGNRFGNWIPIRLNAPKLFCAILFLLSALSLLAVGVWPSALFPLLWLAPLLLVTAWQGMSGRRTIFSSVANGDWSAIVTTALAALIYGFLAELWNYNAAAKWVYQIPYVQRPDLSLFEMPIIGYAGYLPFGLECLLATTMVARVLEFRRAALAGRGDMSGGAHSAWL